MPKCKSTDTSTAVTVGTYCDPCPWTLGSLAHHYVKIDNQRTTNIHSVYSFCRPKQPKLLMFSGADDHIFFQAVISSGSKKADRVDLSACLGSSLQTVEVITTTTYFDATQQDDAETNTGFRGRRESMVNVYELDLP